MQHHDREGRVLEFQAVAGDGQVARNLFARTVGVDQPVVAAIVGDGGSVRNGGSGACHGNSYEDRNEPVDAEVGAHRDPHAVHGTHGPFCGWIRCGGLTVP